MRGINVMFDTLRAKVSIFKAKTRVMKRRVSIYGWLRVLLGMVFVFSGAVKLIDPAGTAIKMEEYFSALGLEFLMPYATVAAVVLILAEWAAGWWLLMKFAYRKTLALVTILLAFFLLLTGYSAVTGKVTDCGCFGDAIKLTPWETFWKNVIFLVMALWLWRDAALRRRTDTHKRWKGVVALAVLAMGTWFAFWTLKHLPVIDFRPFAVGKNIREGMEIPPGAPAYKFKEVWYYKVNGEIKKFSTEDEPWNIPGAEFVKRETIEIQKGYTPPIHDFFIEGEEGDITERILDAPSVYLVLIVRPDRLSDEDYKKLMKTVQRLKEKKATFYLITSEITPKLERWSRAVQTPLNLLDQTVMKTMLRARAGVMYLEHATVKGKWTLDDFLKNWEE